MAKIVQRASQAGIALALGTCYVEKDDGQCYNQLRFYDASGEFLGFHSKTLLCGNFADPPQGEITEYATRPLRTFDIQGIRVGGLICYDMWGNPQCTPMADPHLSQKLSKAGAEIIFWPSMGGGMEALGPKRSTGPIMRSTCACEPLPVACGSSVPTTPFLTRSRAPRLRVFSSPMVNGPNRPLDRENKSPSTRSSSKLGDDKASLKTMGCRYPRMLRRLPAQACQKPRVRWPRSRHC